MGSSLLLGWGWVERSCARSRCLRDTVGRVGGQAAATGSRKRENGARRLLPRQRGAGERSPARMGACNAMDTTKQGAPAETSPPFLGQRLPGRCRRPRPCCGDEPARCGTQRGCAHPSSARRPPRSSPPGERHAGSGGGRWGGQRCPSPSPAPAELTGVSGQRVALPDARLHPAAASGLQGAPGIGQGAGGVSRSPASPPASRGGGERAEGRRAGEGKAGGDAGGVCRGVPVRRGRAGGARTWVAAFHLAQQRLVSPRFSQPPPPGSTLQKTEVQRGPGCPPAPPRSPGAGRLGL